MFWKTKRKLENFINTEFSSHWFLAGGGYSLFLTPTMLLLSYFTAGFYSNTLIDADTNVPIKSIILNLRYFFISKFSSFCELRVQHLFALQFRVTLLRYYLGINQLLIKSSPETEVCSQRERFGLLETFFRQ